MIPFDDAGGDWYTDDAGNTFVNERAWQVSSDPLVATLVDAAAIIKYGHTMKLEAGDDATRH
jgi:cytochrome c oxidase assembly factor CtaG